MRHKEICAIKVHGSIKFAADFALGLITEKLKSRIKFHTSLASAAETIDVSLLPQEYGGTMPMAEMIGRMAIFIFYTRICSYAYNFREIIIVHAHVIRFMES